MGYCTTRILPSSQDMTKIVTEFEKFKYNRLPMGMCASGDIFQAELDELLSDIKGVNIHIDDMIALIKDFFSNHIEQLRIIFFRLRAAGFKVDYPKCSFGLKDIPYLGYTLTREGIEPNLKKLQGIMDIGRPATTTGVPALIGMVQYYKNIWPRRSTIFALMTEVYNGPKGREIFWNDAL